MKLSRRNTLITGGSQGLGRVIVEAFLAEGANVVFCARTAADVAVTQGALNSQLKTGQQLIGLTCDIADPTSVAALFARAAQLGPLHVVVNNAGIYGPIGPTECHGHPLGLPAGDPRHETSPRRQNHYHLRRRRH